MSNSQISTRLAFHKIDDATRALLRDNKDFLLSQLPEVLDGFYQHVSAFSQTSSFFTSRDHMSGAKSAQIKHWAMILDGTFDSNYEASVNRIGEVHNKIGLDPSWYLGGYNALVNGMHQAIAQNLPSRAPANPAIDSLLKEQNIDPQDRASERYYPRRVHRYGPRHLRLHRSWKTRPA